MTVRELSGLLGRMTATAQAVLPALLHYRHLQFLKNCAWKKDPSYETMITLDPQALRELRWWMTELDSWNGRSALLDKPQIVLETNASLLGWGARYMNVSTGALWSEQGRSQYHINDLELFAGSLAVKARAKNRTNIHIRLRMDNTTAIACINKMGGTRSHSLVQLTNDLWSWALGRESPSQPNTYPEYRT